MGGHPPLVGRSRRVGVDGLRPHLGEGLVGIRGPTLSGEGRECRPAEVVIGIALDPPSPKWNTTLARKSRRAAVLPLEVTVQLWSSATGGPPNRRGPCSGGPPVPQAADRTRSSRGLARGRGRPSGLSGRPDDQVCPVGARSIGQPVLADRGGCRRGCTGVRIGRRWGQPTHHQVLVRGPPDLARCLLLAPPRRAFAAVAPVVGLVRVQQLTPALGQPWQFGARYREK